MHSNVDFIQHFHYGFHFRGPSISRFLFRQGSELGRVGKKFQILTKNKEKGIELKVNKIT